MFNSLFGQTADKTANQSQEKSLPTINEESRSDISKTAQSKRSLKSNRTGVSRQSNSSIVTTLEKISEIEEEAYKEFVKNKQQISDLKKQKIQAASKGADENEVSVIDIEIETLEQINEKQQEMFTKKIDIEKQKIEEERRESISSSVASSISKVESWFEANNAQQQQIPPPGEPESDNQRFVRTTSSESRQPEPCTQRSTRTNNPEYRQPNTHNQNVMRTNYEPATEFQRSFSVSATQEDLLLAIREMNINSHGLPNLPEFDGNDILQFPCFLAEYNRTTRRFNLQPSDNLRRLTQSLKGQARTAVQHLLNDPRNIDRILDILENNYGRAEWVALTLKDKIRHLPNVKEEELDSFKRFFNEVTGIVGTLKNLDNGSFIYDPEMVLCLAKKLPALSRSMWGRHKAEIERKRRRCTLEDFAIWLEEELSTQFSLHAPRFDGRTRQPRTNVVHHLNAVPSSQCLGCKDDTNHPLYKCPRFNEMNIIERRKLVKEAKICFNCLRKGHGAMKCKSENRCNKCKKLHHSMLHKDDHVVNAHVSGEINSDSDTGPDESDVNTSFDEQSNGTSESQLHINSGRSSCILRMTRVKIRGPLNTIEVDALFDEGSTASIVDKNLMDLIGVSGPTLPITYRWTNKISRREVNSMIVDFEVASINPGSKFHKLVGVRTTNDIALPSQSINVDEIKQKYPMIDPLVLKYVQSSKPKLLIGANNAGLIVPLKTLQYDIEGLQATKSHLGWTLYGPLDSSKPTDESPVHVIIDEDIELNELVKLQFKLDSFGANAERPRLSKEDDRALQIMNNTCKKVGNRYQIGHLYKNENIAFPTAASYSMALKRLEKMEEKMDVNPDFAQKYCDKVNDYINKGYATKLIPSEQREDHKTFYLPHFGVFNPNKPGKFRLVFDAKVKAGGYSLNDLLLKGPDLVPALIAVIWRARTHPVAFMSDIEEMFLQVHIRPEDRNSQRFLFRGRDRNRKPDIYVMNSMIFGAVSSPSKAQFVKNENARALETKLPGVLRPIKEQHYVDDYFDNAANREIALQTINNVRTAHAEGGFRLVKWVTNDPLLTEQIPEELRAPESTSPYGHRVLGIYWDDKTDEFVYPLDFTSLAPVYLSGQKKFSKRVLLKFMMGIFDPLGCLSPLTIQLKIIFQDVWREEVSWDDPLPDQMQLRVMNWFDIANQLKPIRIPRQYFPQSQTYNEVDLIVICDASNKAYCVTAYYRIKEGNTYRLAQVQAKSRVAPLKPVPTVPKLELQAMALGGQIGQTICDETNLIIRKRFFWTDSEIALNWLRSTKKLSPYVAARVGKALEFTKINEWYWLSTDNNSANGGTKELPEIDLKPDSLWSAGPSFLTLEERDWPDSNIPVLKDEQKIILFQKEIVPEVITLHLTPNDTPTVSIGNLMNIERFSSFNRLVRATAAVLAAKERFKCKRSDRKNPVEISLKHIRDALKYWIQQTQQDKYEEDMNDLRASGYVKKSSDLYNLSPTIMNGILRVKGRIPNYNPIILPHKSDFTRLLVNWYHVAFAHHGIDTILTSLKAKYWIPRPRTLVKHIAISCETCKVKRTQPPIPEMGPLPPERHEQTIFPFTNCGVDYFGPVYVTVGRHHEKRWVALFTCLTTRAVHVELVKTLNTSSMIMALSRFTSLRGTPRKIFSDNGTNFKGADNELKAFIQGLRDEKIEDQLSIRNIEWIFIPPASPNFGGCWERYVKSIKTALSAILKEQYPSEEVLATALCESANIVNNRPLTRPSDDVNDLPPITPNDIILLRKNDNMFEVDFDPKEIDCRALWKKSQWIADQFWKRWVKEYRPTLVKKSKWFDSRKYYEVKTNDHVVIVDEQLKRGQWPRGIVEETFPGRDGITRVVTVRTNKGIYKRPVTKVALICRAPENVVNI